MPLGRRDGDAPSLAPASRTRARARAHGDPQDGRASVSGAQGPEELADLVRRVVTSPM